VLGRVHGQRAVCHRTLQRDMDVLRLRYGAPVEFDWARRGYYLTDPEWTFPLDGLRGELLYASLLGGTLSAKLMPPPLGMDLEQAMRVQLTAAEPDEIDAELLAAVVFATGAAPRIDPKVFDAVHQAWRQRRRLRTEYEGSGDRPAARRDIDVHALFLSQGAWYARAYCHLRKAPRSLAIHRIRNAMLLDTTFKRDRAVIAEVRNGRVFDYERVKDIVLDCSPEKARVIGEREWFPGQRMERLPDGRLRLHLPEAPRPDLVYWVMSYCGHLTVRSPRGLVEEIRKAGERIAQQHSARRLQWNRKR
jgi:proteasome accessory factor B